MPHTYGPWVLLKSRSINGARIYSENARVTVAQLTAKADKPINQKESDGFLIAVAPDLLKSARAIIAWALKYNQGHEGSELLEILSDTNRAIAKAEGRHAL